MTPPATVARRHWLATLARSPHDALRRLAPLAVDGHAFEWLRAPETGLAMLRARIGNAGDRFNVGEATLTRCVVRHRGADGSVSAGVGYVLGHDTDRATWVAKLDALLQQPAHHAALMRDVVEPLAAATAKARDEARTRTAASRVRFFTLEPEAGT